MKISLLKRSMSVPAAAMLLTTALGGPVAGAERVVPFTGSLQVMEPVVSQGPTSFVVAGSGGGIATHLGRFTLTWRYEVLFATGTGSGPATFVAANGDRLFTAATGTSAPTETAGVFRIMEIYTVTGGTGRFDGASGSFTSDRLTDLNTGFTSGSFSGAISSPGAAGR
jgi:hypothetical protein